MSMRRHVAVRTFGLALVLLTPGAIGVPQEASPPADPPPAVEEPGRSEPPSLDDLLGIDEERQDPGAVETAEREHERELQRRLAEQELGDAFRQALDKMVLSAELLEVKFDPGLGTQRVQEDILRKLEVLIDKAEEMQRQGMGSSAGAQQQQSQQQQPQQAPPGRQRQDQGERADQRSEQPNDGMEAMPPARQEGDINVVIEETRTEWGNLPERIREMLLQGRREKFSSLYEQLTREYYRRLAEEGSP